MYEDEKQRFKSKQGYELNLDNPQSFNEKVVCKKLFDRNPLLVLTADKYRVRQYIREKIGWEAEYHLIPLLFVTDNPETIPFDRLPEQYIIKPNNGAGRWIIVESIKDYRTEYTVDRIGTFYDIENEKIINYCKQWFKTVHGAEWHEWAYGEIEPLIVVEELLYENANIPFSYKFCMFDGECKMIYVLNRDDITINIYDADFNMLDVKRKHHPLGPRKEKPKEFGKMIGFAEKLSEGFDFVRIDFYLVDDYVYFGEITHYPGSGHGVFEPQEYDFELGRCWKLRYKEDLHG